MPRSTSYLCVLQDSLLRLSRLQRFFQCPKASAACLRVRSRPISQPDKRKKFNAYPIGYLQVDFAELRTETGKQYLFVAVGRAEQSRHSR